MKKQNPSDVDAILPRKRVLVESVNDELKNICKLEHTWAPFHKGILGTSGRNPDRLLLFPQETFFEDNPNWGLSEKWDKIPILVC